MAMIWDSCRTLNICVDVELLIIVHTVWIHLSSNPSTFHTDHILYIPICFSNLILVFYTFEKTTREISFSIMCISKFSDKHYASKLGARIVAL